MAPEQLFGHSSERTDIYAAALVTFEMLTAKRLTELMCENPTEVEPALRRELSAVPPPIAPAAIDAILQAANPDPAKRPQDIESWSRDLSATLLDYVNFER